MSGMRRHPPRVDVPSLRASSPVIDALAALPADRRAVEAERLWDRYDHPVVEADPDDPGSRRVTFLARDDAADGVLISVNRVTGDLASSRMTRLAGTGLWWACFRLDARWRGSYGLLPVTGDAEVDLAGLDQRWAVRTLRERCGPDPRNPLRQRGHGGGWSSVAHLPHAPAQPWLSPVPPGAGGSVSEAVAPGGRRVWLHLPAQVREDHPCVVLFDGDVWQGNGQAGATVDNLVADGLITPPVVVMIDQGTTAQRVADLSADGSLGGWVASDLLGWVRDTWPVSARPERTVVVGQSLGGLTALSVALRRPDVVGCALAQSSSLWQDDLLDGVATASSLRADVQVGTYEPVLLDAHRRLAASARERGLDVELREYVGGHDLAWWRGGLADGLRRLIPA